MQPLSPVQTFDQALYEAFGLEVFIKRDDLIHPVISGNKWRKLKYTIDKSLALNAKYLVSFGGAYSNHLHALAFAGREKNIPTIGYVRGELHASLNPTLQDCVEWGMKLIPMSRKDYRDKTSADFLTSAQQRFPDSLIIPEGGSNTLALQGVGEIFKELTEKYDYIVAPVGSAGTLSGLIAHCPWPETQLLGVAVLKGGFLSQTVKQHLNDAYPDQTVPDNWCIVDDFHFGGYAKYNERLIKFLIDVGQRTGVPLEPVYSGKMVFALHRLVQKKWFKPGSKVLLLHTGGMQGLRGLQYACRSCPDKLELLSQLAL